MNKRRSKITRVDLDFFDKVNSVRHKVNNKYGADMSFPKITKLMADKWDIIEDEIFNVTEKRQKKRDEWRLFK